MSRRWLPGRDQVLNNRWVRPFGRHLNDDRLWHFDREPVARGAAVGVFFGLMLPIAQFLFAILSAIMVRGNVPTAAACTLVTNPLTFPPIYWLAYQLGSWLTDDGGSTPPDAPLAAPIEAAPADTGWVQSLMDWTLNAGLPLITGLFVMACCGSVLSYVLVRLLWRARPH